MTKIFAVYLQASGFASQSSEYAFECGHKQLGRYGIPLLMLILLLSLCRWTVIDRAVSVDFLQEFDVRIFYPLFLKRGQYCLSLH